MLELRPTCEHCRRPLPPESNEAMICSFECTFCSSCVATVLLGVCPNCGGNFVQRPVRPVKDLKNGNHLGQFPASERVVERRVDTTAHREFIKSIRETVGDGAR